MPVTPIPMEAIMNAPTQRTTGTTSSTSQSIVDAPSNALPPVPQSDDSTALQVQPETKEKQPRRIVAVVVDAGKMSKTVKVRIPGQRWNAYLRKHYPDHTQCLVHDPNSSLNIGDVISLRPHRASKHAHHIVHSILSPFGPPISARPPVPSEAEMQAQYDEKRGRKLDRRALRRSAAMGDAEAIKELEQLGVHPGQGVAAGKGEKKELSKGLVGNKGQKLMPGVLPGGKHAVGKIDERAKRNKNVANARNEKAEVNTAEAKRRAEQSGEARVGRGMGGRK